MAAIPLNSWALLAEAFRYPRPGQLVALADSADNLPAGPARQAFAMFIEQLNSLTQGQWEELYTRTLDLDPPAAPYVGYQVWGESYLRGRFMVELSRLLAEAGVDPAGELPDHLVAVLGYFAAVETPSPEVSAALGTALDRMAQALAGTDPGNPYTHLLAAAQVLWQSQQKEAA